MPNNYKLSDAVIFRMIQIFQEALLLGVDGADLFRQVKLVVDSEQSDTLVLDPEYKKMVSDMHHKYLLEAEKLKQEKDLQKFIL